MDLKEYKLSDFETKIIDLPDRIVGRAGWLKEQFDARGIELQQALNELIEALAGENGAALLGAVDLKGSKCTIQEHIRDVDNPHNMAEKIKALVAEEMKTAGTGDMVAADYDPQGKKTDVFAYTDNAIKAAIGSALTGEV